MIRPSNPLIGPIVAVNLGLLVVFLFGPNAPRAQLPVALAGAGIALAGAVVLVRAIVIRRRASKSSSTKAL